MFQKILASALSLAVISGCASTSGANREEPSVAQGINDRYATEEGQATSLKIFEGEGRERYQKRDEIIQHMELREGDVVCEVGAGSGYLIEGHGWDHVGTRKFLDYQYFAVFRPR